MISFDEYSLRSKKEIGLFWCDLGQWGKRSAMGVSFSKAGNTKASNL
ncbi:hypothetical protein VCRA2120E57_110098 [Vibrio crassostreae]|nr:hypothetical protein VCRA2120E57_110098 [Vibrio crassostreae]